MSEQANKLLASARAKQTAVDYFTGLVWVTPIVKEGDPTDCVVREVTFEPGARTNWHTHPNGQILLVTAGAGYYQEKGRPARRLCPGDAVSLAPGVGHWHGASAESFCTYYTINPNASQEVTSWGAPVAAAEYQAAHT
jgi:quercetin dioxygenase-like cupin family protein